MDNHNNALPPPEIAPTPPRDIRQQMNVSPAAYYPRPITILPASASAFSYSGAGIRPPTAYYSPARPISLPPTIPAATRAPMIPAVKVEEAAPSNIGPPMITAVKVEEADPSDMWVYVEHTGYLVKFKLALPLMKELKAAVKIHFRYLRTRGMVLKFTHKDLEGDRIVIADDEDLELCFQYFKALNQPVRLLLEAFY